MSTSTYLQLCQETQAACDISGTPISSVANQIGILKDLVRWVADADIVIQREAINWDFLYKTDFTVNTVVGIADYVKPSDYGKWDRKTFFLDYTTDTNIKLREIDYRVYFNTYAVGVQTNGPPNNFIIQPGGNLSIYNPPDQVYTLTANYWRTAKRMTANGDVSLIPETFIRAIIARAKMYYAISEEADRVYAEAKGEYGDVLSELKSDQLPGWEDYLISDGVDLTVSTDGFTGDVDGGGSFNSGFNSGF